MANVSINIDTENGSMEVVIGGETIQNVTSLEAYKYVDYDGESEVRLSVRTRVENETSDVVKYEEYVCCEDKFVKSNKSKVEDDIVKYFEGK